MTDDGAGDTAGIVALAGTDPALDDDDLAEWGRSVAEARVVGLGLTVPGSRELTRLGQRLLAHLVLSRGVRRLALAAGESATTRVDALVRDGVGNPDEVLPALRTWTWNSREMVAVVRWLAEHNREVDPADRVRVVGVDAAHPLTAVTVVGRYLRAAAPETLAEVSEPLAGLAGHGSGVTAAATVAATEHVVAVLDRDRAALVAETSPAQHEEARRHAHFLVRSAALAADPSPAHRARLIADAVVDAGGDGLAPVVLWGHADQVVVRGDGVGALLRDRFGAGYHALVATCGTGEVRARTKRFLRGPSRTPVRRRLDEPLATSVEAALDREAGADEGVLLDLRRAPARYHRELRRRAVDDEVPTGPGATTTFTPVAEADTLAHVVRTAPAVDR